MSAYRDAVLATTGLRHYWILGDDDVDLNGGLTLTGVGAGVTRPAAGATQGEHAAKFLGFGSSYMFANSPPPFSKPLIGSP